MAARTATILVTDLVGSTEQRVRLGEERAEALRQVHDGLAADAVAAAGGTVVKGLGDGVLATFPGAAEAISAAVAMQRAVAAHTRHHPEAPLVLRAGISSGDVETMATDVFGTPVVEAARLCAEAEGAQILVADLSRSLARGRGGHQFRSVGELGLKGLPDPVPASEVLWTEAPHAPLPPLLHVTRSSPMVGRHAERERLGQLWREAAAGQRRVVLVAGEPGIGKTRLVAEVAADAGADDAVVVYGHCDEELEAPFRPWVEVVRALLATLPAEVIAAHDAEWGRELARLVPELGSGEGRPGDADSERLRLFDAVADLLHRAGARTPLLVILDDLHWADRSTLLLLRHVVLGPIERPWLLIVTYRDTDLSRRHPLAVALAALRQAPGVERIVLGGLDLAAVEDLLGQRALRGLDRRGADVLARRLAAETAGNPFFIGEVVTDLVESGALSGGTADGGSGHLVEGVPVPEGVRDAVTRRLASLSDTVTHVLTGSAVVGAQFDATLVAHVLDAPLDEVVDALDAALARRLLVELPGHFGRYRFAHALVRQALEEELSHTRRIRLHHRIALSLEEIGAPTADIARHFAAGAAEGDSEKAVEWCRRAAAEALEGLAYDEAVAYFETALHALGGGAARDGERADLLMLLASAANHAGDDAAWRAAAVDAAAIARRLRDPERLAHAALSLVGTLGPGMAEDQAVIAAMVDAADLLRTADSSPSREALRAEVLARHGAYVATHRPRESAALGEEALAVARRAGDPRVLAIALLYSTLTYGLERHEHEARLREAARLAEEGGDREVVLSANTGLMIAALLWADRDEFDRCLAENARVATEMGAATPLLLNAIDHAGAAALDGRYADAEEQLAEARARASDLRDPSHDVAVGAAMFPVVREFGRLAQMAPAAADAVVARPRAPYEVFPLVWGLAEAGQHEKATVLLHAALAQPEELRSGYLRRFGLAFATETVAVLDDARAAAELDPMLREEARHGVCVNVGAHLYLGALSRYRGLVAHALGRWDDAVRHHEAALEVHEGMRAHGWAARSRYDLARALLARHEPGDAERATRLLDEATSEAHEMGMPKLLEELGATQRKAEP